MSAKIYLLSVRFLSYSPLKFNNGNFMSLPFNLKTVQDIFMKLHRHVKNY